MSLIVLFDLDETLLATNMDQFLPGYFELLSQAFRHLGSHDQITRQINFAVGKMLANQQPEQTLQEVFADNFYPHLGTTEQACQSLIETFYQDKYPHLKPITQSKPEASELVTWCQARGMTMAVATNPLFPAIATRQRIEWAGLDPKDFHFYTSYDDFHFTKPHLTYYAELLGRLGWPEHPLVMIGDNLTDDLFPMDTIGAETFWINHRRDHAVWEGGTLSEVKPWLQQMIQSNSSRLSAQPKVNIAILQSTPAVIDTWLRFPPDETNQHGQIPQDLRIMDLLSALTSFEESVYHPLIERIVAGAPYEAPESDPSLKMNAKSDLQHQSTKETFSQFLQARKNSLVQIGALFKVGKQNQDKQLAQPIYSLIAWMAEQDRKHLRQYVNL